MSRYVEALKSIATTGMPEEGQENGRPPKSGFSRSLHSGVVEQPEPQIQPGISQRIRQGVNEEDPTPDPFIQGVNAITQQARAQAGVKLGNAFTNAIFHGVDELPSEADLAGKADAAERLKQIATTTISTAARLTASGAKGAANLSVRGILAVINALRNRRQSNQKNTNHGLQLYDQDEVINGEYKEI